MECGYFHTLASAIFRKIPVMASVPPSALWISMIEVS